jgi:tRNA threonylcarbamoyladenosine biosynthesis protein TsaE
MILNNYDIIKHSKLGDNMKKEIKINSLEDLNRFAKTLSKYFFPGFVLCLEGDLGAGKTTFTKYLGKHMGITSNISSPTFTILKVYENDLPLYHMDVYRLQGIGSDYDLEEYIYGDGVCVIEWYHNIIYSLPEDVLSIDIKIVDEHRRILEVKGTGKYENFVKALSD